MTIDINCDMGESFGRYSIGRDFDILQYISSCNVACGFHGGDPKIIIETIKEAHKQGVKIGAHPSYPDLQGFGRRRMIIPHEELVPIIQYQIAVIDKLSEIHGKGLSHVKPHGALYNHAYESKEVANSIIDAFSPWKKNVLLFAQFGSQLANSAIKRELNVIHEGFVDRRYIANLNLMNRSDPKALHNEIDDMIDQALSMIKDKKVMTPDGKKDIVVSTICVHGDHPKAIEIVKQLVLTLNEEGIDIK